MDDMERTQQFSRTIPCPYCGEEYSITYKSCPFCDGGNNRKKSEPRKKGKAEKPEKRRKPARRLERGSEYEGRPEKRGALGSEPEFIEIQEITRKEPVLEEREEPDREMTAAEKLLELEALIESIKSDESIEPEEETLLDEDKQETESLEEDAPETVPPEAENRPWEERKEASPPDEGAMEEHPDFEEEIPSPEESRTIESAEDEGLAYEDILAEDGAVAEEQGEDIEPSFNENLDEARRLVSEETAREEAEDAYTALEEVLALEQVAPSIEETVLEIPAEELEQLSGEDGVTEGSGKAFAGETEDEDRAETQEEAGLSEAANTEKTQEENLAETIPNKESAAEMDKSPAEGKVSAAPTPSGGGKRLQKKSFGLGRVLLIILSLAIIAAAVYIVVTKVVPIVQTRLAEREGSSQSADQETVAFGLNETTVTLTKEGETKQLSVKAGASGEGAVTWKSSDAEVAMVSEDGLVTAVAAGSAKITASNEDGQSAQCEVLCVLDEDEEAKEGSAASGEVYLNKTDFTLYQGQSFEMKAVGTEQKPIWTSDKPTVATVSESGVVQYVGEGTANVTAEVGGETLSAIVRCIGRAAP